MLNDLNSFVFVPLTSERYMQLAKRYPDRVNSVIENVIDDFLERTEDDIPRIKENIGLYWEALFLPSETQIRTKYFGEYKVASIQGDQIIWNGEAYPSMAQLTNKMRGNTSNNAWKELEIKRPDDKQWVAAQALRR